MVSMREAIAWRWRYIAVPLNQGVIQRLPMFPVVFSSLDASFGYIKCVLSHGDGSSSRLIRLRQLGGRAVNCRIGTSDPWVLWDTFYKELQQLPAEVSDPRCIVDLGANVGYTAAYFAA